MVAFDYEERSTYPPVLRGVSSVFLVTAYTVDMLVHSKLFIDACKAAGVKHVVVSGCMQRVDRSLVISTAPCS